MEKKDEAKKQDNFVISIAREIIIRRDVAVQTAFSIADEFCKVAEAYKETGKVLTIAEIMQEQRKQVELDNFLNDLFKNDKDKTK